MDGRPIELETPLHVVLPCLAAKLGPTLEELTLIRCPLGTPRECSTALVCLPQFAELRRLSLSFDAHGGTAISRDEQHHTTGAKLRALLAPFAATLATMRASRAAAAVGTGTAGTRALPRIDITIEGCERSLQFLASDACCAMLEAANPWLTVESVPYAEAEDSKSDSFDYDSDDG